MLKKILLTSAMAAVIGVLVFGAVYRTQAKTEIENGSFEETGGYGRNRDVNENSLLIEENRDLENNGGGRGQGGSGKGNDEIASYFSSAPGELSLEETEALAFMREEEKLAHDVYAVLYSQWGLPIFQNISASEQTHSDAVKTLLDRYGVPDPALSEAGAFSNPDLQSLYDNLIALGSQSQVEALKVGAAIEEIDILDLEEWLSKTDNTEIKQTLTNLLNGSYNHLRSFSSMLESRNGEEYQPQYLTPEEYQAIISSSEGRGGGNGQRGGGQGGGNGRWNQTNPINS